jgi:hypothetical protein
MVYSILDPEQRIRLTLAPTNVHLCGCNSNDIHFWPRDTKSIDRCKVPGCFPFAPPITKGLFTKVNNILCLDAILKDTFLLQCLWGSLSRVRLPQDIDVADCCQSGAALKIDAWVRQSHFGHFCIDVAANMFGDTKQKNTKHQIYIIFFKILTLKTSIWSLFWRNCVCVICNNAETLRNTVHMTSNFGQRWTNIDANVVNLVVFLRKCRQSLFGEIYDWRKCRQSVFVFDVIFVGHISAPRTNRSPAGLVRDIDVCEPLGGHFWARWPQVVFRGCKSFPRSLLEISGASWDHLAPEWPREPPRGLMRVLRLGATLGLLPGCTSECRQAPYYVPCRDIWLAEMMSQIVCLDWNLVEHGMQTMNQKPHHNFNYQMFIVIQPHLWFCDCCGAVYCRPPPPSM